MSSEKGEGSGGGGGLENFAKSGTRSPQEIEDGIHSTPTVTWDPFTVLPKEIYLNIFNNLDNPSDKQNFMNAHVKWYNLFKPERVLFLFGKVFEDLDLDDDEETDKNYIGLRLVCRDWDKSIQDYYQLHPDHFQFAFCEDEWENSPNDLKWQYLNGYVIFIAHLPYNRELGTDLEEFLLSHPPSRNPLLTRKVMITCSNLFDTVQDEHLSSLWNQVDTLLETYGRHIYHFRLEDKWHLTPVMYSRIVKWLGLMPELKTLHLKFSNWVDSRYQDTSEFREVLQNVPEMKKLQNLHVLYIPPCVFINLLESMKAIEKLEIGVHHTPTFLLDLERTKLPTNLREAALTLSSYEDFNHLHTYLQMSPFLQKLIININHSYCYSSVRRLIPWPEWKSIWKTLEENFPSLEELQLSLPRCANAYKEEANKQSLECRLNLRKLKRLSIILPNLCSLDFMKEIKTLQELKINFEYFHNKCQNLHRMWESKIWRVFPNMTKLTINALAEVEEKKRNVEVHSYEKTREGGKTYNKTVQELPERSAYLLYR